MSSDSRTQTSMMYTYCGDYYKTQQPPHTRSIFKRASNLRRILSMITVRRVACTIKQRSKGATTRYEVS